MNTQHWITPYAPNHVEFRLPRNHGLSHHRPLGGGWYEIDLLDITGSVVETARFHCA